MKLKIKRESKIGLFVLAMLFTLYWGINYLKGKDLFSRNNTYYALYDQVNGIQPSSAVVIRGFKVGTISNMSFNPTISDKIMLELSIKSKFRIPVNSRARIFSDGLLGGKGVEIELGDSGYFLNNGDTLRSYMDKDFLEVAGSELEFFKQKAGALVEQVMETLGYINILLEKNTGNITAATTNLADITASLRNIASAESGGMQDITSNINLLTKKMNSSADKLDHMLTGMGSITDSLQAADIPQLIHSLSYTAGQLSASIDKINNGDGTAGKLVNDPQLYDSLTKASESLNKLLTDIKARPGRYVSFSVFGRRDR